LVSVKFNTLNAMELFYEILKLTIPASIVFLTTYFLVKNFLDQDVRKQTLSVKRGNQEIITPIRLQAFERIALFLERINPNSIVLRVNINTSAGMLEAEIIKTIRSEFDHNVAQQIYISRKTWDAIVKAKDESIKLVNVAGTKVNKEASGMELAQTLLIVSAQLTQLPTKEAMDLVKKEISKEF
jgi:hypothetical protein